MEIGLDYIICVAGNVWASTSDTARDKYSGILGEIRLKAGERRYMRNAVYHKTLQISTHLTSRERQEDRAMVHSH